MAEFHQWLLVTPDLEVARWMRRWRGEGEVPQVTAMPLFRCLIQSTTPVVAPWYIGFILLQPQAAPRPVAKKRTGRRGQEGTRATPQSEPVPTGGRLEGGGEDLQPRVLLSRCDAEKPPEAPGHPPVDVKQEVVVGVFQVVPAEEEPSVSNIKGPPSCTVLCRSKFLIRGWPGLILYMFCSSISRTWSHWPLQRKRPPLWS